MGFYTEIRGLFRKFVTSFVENFKAITKSGMLRMGVIYVSIFDITFLSASISCRFSQNV